MPSVCCFIKQSFDYQFNNWGQGGAVNILVVAYIFLQQQKKPANCGVVNILVATYILNICAVIYFCNNKNPSKLMVFKNCKN
jgi:hypothetical protein